VNDPFALLGVPNRPWIDPEILKQNFLARSSNFHPDRVHQAPDAEKSAAHHRFTELNQAYQTLLDPRERLLRLLELESGGRRPETQNIPPDLMGLFMDVGKVSKEADAFLTEKAAQTSPLLKVQIFERAQQWIERMRETQQRVTQSGNALLEEIRALDSGWENISASEKQNRLIRLQEIAGLLNYSKKWNAQLEEKILRLSF
jgi:curved DNA-binding protein CbpA